MSIVDDLKKNNERDRSKITTPEEEIKRWIIKYTEEN